MPFRFVTAAINGAVFRPLVMQSRAPVYLLTVGGARHYDFTDFPLLAPPFKLTGQLGPIAMGEMQRMMTAYTLALRRTSRPDGEKSTGSPPRR
jgi:hypothetical protein